MLFLLKKIPALLFLTALLCLAQTVQAADQGLDPNEVAQDLTELAGDAASDLGKVVADALSKFGRPSAMIVGGEAGGSYVIGYLKGHGKFVLPGSGRENRDIYWASPSIGFQGGVAADKTVFLVYGANSIAQLSRRFTAVEAGGHTLAGGSMAVLRSSLDPEDHNAITLVYITVGGGLDGGIALESMAFRPYDFLL
jgi:hypothetical protein